jgi:hypothetical protein
LAEPEDREGLGCVGARDGAVVGHRRGRGSGLGWWQWESPRPPRGGCRGLWRRRRECREEGDVDLTRECGGPCAVLSGPARRLVPAEFRGRIYLRVLHSNYACIFLVSDLVLGLSELSPGTSRPFRRNPSQ